LNITIEDIPGMDDTVAVLSLHENEKKHVGLAIMVPIHLDDFGSIGANKAVIELYGLLSQLPGIRDCSIEYMPNNFNKETVDWNLSNEPVLKYKLKRRLTLSYMAPEDGLFMYHTIIIGMRYNARKFTGQVRYSFEKMGALFNGEVAVRIIPHSQ